MSNYKKINYHIYPLYSNIQPPRLLKNIFKKQYRKVIYHVLFYKVFVNVNNIYIIIPYLKIFRFLCLNIHFHIVFKPALLLKVDIFS